jgi:hypothetical protein
MRETLAGVNTFYWDSGEGGGSLGAELFAPATLDLQQVSQSVGFAQTSTSNSQAVQSMRGVAREMLDYSQIFLCDTFRGTTIKCECSAGGAEWSVREAVY